jgi:hypothetical protein
MPVHRLEAEAVRDSLLAISGHLDRTQFGPSIVPHISKYQEGRGKPQSGPLDGNGRRSIYIQVRRNFLTPMFLAFDYPLPVSTVGTRGASAVPAQALMMLNNEFVALTAKWWAERTSNISETNTRIETLFEEAYARKPEAWELKETVAFLASRGNSPDAWTDLCHVLVNSAEFIYVR